MPLPLGLSVLNGITLKTLYRGVLVGLFSWCPSERIPNTHEPGEESIPNPRKVPDCVDFLDFQFCRGVSVGS